MIKILLLLIAVYSSYYTFFPLSFLKEQLRVEEKILSVLPSINTQTDEIRHMLKEANHLREPVMNKVIATLKCATQYHVETNPILTIIDYSLPSNEKRLWVFDLNTKQMLYHTYVSHGIRSGTLLTSYFSNKNDSKASSIGVYKTQQAYYGREGLSLRLEGLDRNFNDNAASRSVVMHGGWYVEEGFIKRYGRPGRSWGCPALPLDDYKPVITTIKDHSLMVIYYPSDDWFGKSKFLTCNSVKSSSTVDATQTQVLLPPDDVDKREPILFVDLNRNNKHEENEPVIVVSADAYEKIFHAQAPLGRMLRRQIAGQEYIALSHKEFNQLAAQNNKEGLDAIRFVIPEIIMVRGYYETQMKLVNLGTINLINTPVSQTSDLNSLIKEYSVSTNTRSGLQLKTTQRFIRWVGL